MSSSVRKSALRRVGWLVIAMTITSGLMVSVKQATVWVGIDPAGPFVSISTFSTALLIWQLGDKRWFCE